MSYSLPHSITCNYDLTVDVCQEIVRAAPVVGRAVLVGIDGVDGSGKTTFAARLATAYDDAGRRTVVVHADDFLNPRAVRYRLGRSSPEGFFLDSVDLVALRQKVLDPVRAGAQTIIAQHFDLRADSPVVSEPVGINADTVVIVEGMFLHREELNALWDYSVFLDVPFEVSVQRMAERDRSHPDPAHPSNQRYVEGQRLYLSRCGPRARAKAVVDNAGSEPRIVSEGADFHDQQR